MKQYRVLIYLTTVHGLNKPIRYYPHAASARVAINRALLAAAKEKDGPYRELRTPLIIEVDLTN